MEAISEQCILDSKNSNWFFELHTPSFSKQAVAKIAEQ